MLKTPMIAKFFTNFKNGGSLFTRKQTNILSAATVLMLAVFGSRILGLLRDRLLAGAFFSGGRQALLDVYFAAFRLPDMLFQLLVLGALSAAFIPVFSKFLETDEKRAWHIASSVISIALLVFLPLGFIIFFLARPLSQLIAPTFSPSEIILMARLTKIMLLAQLFFVLSNFLTGILQSYQCFLVPALAPVFYNLGIIAGILFLSPFLGIYGPTIGVVIGAFLHFLIQVPVALSLGFSFKPTFDIKEKSVRLIGRLMLPRTISLAVSQIELTVAVFIATSLSAGSLAIFYFAQHLNALPVGLFGLTIGQAALPSLSKEAEKGLDNFKNLFLSSLKQILYLALPASVVLVILRIPLVRIAFGAREFPWKATLLTGKVVSLFAISVFAQSAIQLLIRGFYALKNTKTPLVVGGLAVFINVFLSFLFVYQFSWGVEGLALAMSCASFIQAILLFLILDKKVKGFEKSNYLPSILRMFLASTLTGIALWVPMRFLDRFVLNTTKTIQLVFLTILASLSGAIVYLSLSYFLKIKELESYLRIIRKFGRWRKVLADTEEILDTPQAPATAAPEKE